MPRAASAQPDPLVEVVVGSEMKEAGRLLHLTARAESMRLTEVEEVGVEEQVLISIEWRGTSDTQVGGGGEHRHTDMICHTRRRSTAFAFWAI
jgi:hypothetical protein